MFKSFVCVLAMSVVTAASAAIPEDAPKIPQPNIPPTKVSITDFGAVGDGKTACTDAIANAITKTALAGGGVIVVPRGTYLTRHIALASNTELHLDKGATLLLDDAETAYRNERGGNDNCISADNCHDVAITGDGTIDGQGARWWQAFRKIKGLPNQNNPANHRPYMVVFNKCTRVRLSDVTLTNSPSFHLVPGSCTDVTIDNVHFKAPADAPNTDALDPSGWNFSITNCTFDTGDDCIAIKPSGSATADKLSCEDFFVSDCTFLHGHGLSVGGQTPGGLRRLTVRRCAFDGTAAGIRLKAGRGTGGLVEDLTYDHEQRRGADLHHQLLSQGAVEARGRAAAAGHGEDADLEEHSHQQSDGQ